MSFTVHPGLRIVSVALLLVAAVPGACAGAPPKSSVATSLAGRQKAEPASHEKGQRKPAEVMSWRGARWLERESRAQDERPDLLLEIMGLARGDVVADVGCGTGFYARRMAQRVAPEGKVFGVDIQPEMLEFLEELAAQESIRNIIPVLGEPNDPKLPAASMDWILLVDVYHEFQDPESMLAQLREALAPDGRIALVEFRLEGDTARHIKKDHRMSPEQVLDEWIPAGFELVEQNESLPSQHMFIFEKSDLPVSLNVPESAFEMAY